jgi:hypothetical protein
MFVSLAALKNATKGTKAGFWFEEVDVEVHGRRFRNFSTSNEAAYIIVSESVPKKTREEFFVVKFVCEGGVIRAGKMTQPLDSFVDAATALGVLMR